MVVFPRFSPAGDSALLVVLGDQIDLPTNRRLHALAGWLHHQPGLGEAVPGYAALLAHVKPHGALYNQAARDPALARAIASAVAKFRSQLILVGLAGSALIAAGEEAHLRTASEAFPDRAYNPDGSLRSRKLPGAVLDDPADVVEHALELAAQGIKIDTGSRTTYIPVNTLCLHGDHAHAGENAQ